MGTLSTSAFRQKLADSINRAAYGRERIVIEKNGKEMVALVSIDDLRLLQALEDKLDLEAAKRARRGSFITLDELEEKLDLE